MPSYGTHAIHAIDVSKEYSPKIEINVDLLKRCAIGHDSLILTQFYKCFKKAHVSDTNAFFISIMNYIKDNNLNEDMDAMAFLYGHIIHYALDVKAHPLIYYMTLNGKMFAPIYRDFSCLLIRVS